MAGLCGRLPPPRPRLRTSGGLRCRFSGVRMSAVSPQPMGSRANIRVRGKKNRTCSRSCSAAMIVRFSACQPWTTSRRSAVVRASMAVKGSSRIMTGQSWRNRRANRTRWNCPADRLPMGSVLKPVQAHCCQSLPGLVPLCCPSCRRTCRLDARAPEATVSRTVIGKLRSISACCGK